VKAFALVLAAIVVAMFSVPSVGHASGGTHGCRPPHGPGDNLIHSAHVRAQQVGCQTARIAILKCARFSYGSSGPCTAARRRWHCTSRRIPRSISSSERCGSGHGVVRWIWLD
jgi:hypothetical protein